MSQRFLQLELSEESRKYLGFQIEGITYQYRRLPFVTSVSPGHFIRNMIDIFESIIDRSLSIYMDDIQIKTNNFENLVYPEELLKLEYAYINYKKF